jgi:DNA polymerase III epsilon subunit-like protein
LRLAALDVETTCLDPRRCRVVAAALVPLCGDRVCLRGALYAVSPEARSCPEAALVHGIVAGRAHVEPNTGLDNLLREATGYTLITYGRHDAAFLAQEAIRRGLAGARYCYMDLLSYLLQSPTRLHRAMTAGSYTLEQALEEVLGFHPAPRRLHDPLEDAVYTALLYLALRSRGAEPPRRCTRASRGNSLAEILTGLARRLLGRHH